MFLPSRGRVLPLTCETTTRIDKEMLFDSARLRVGHVVTDLRDDIFERSP